MSTLINILKILVIVYLALLFLMAVFQERLIFFRQSLDRSVATHFQEIEFQIERNGISLHGWYVKKEVGEPSPLIIYYGGNAEEVSANLMDLDRFPPGAYLFMNYRGYGKSEGKPTETSLIEDALYVLDWMVENEGVDPKQIILMGRSLGSGVATQVAARRTVGALILVTPFDSLVKVAQSHYPVFPVKALIRHRFDSVKAAEKIDTPALILMGTTDSIVPNRHSERLAEAWKGPVTKVVIDHADHLNIHLYDEYWSAIHDFVAGIGDPSQDV